MGKIVFGTIGILLYKYLPRLITFVPLGVAKALVCVVMIIGYILYDKELQKKNKRKISIYKIFLFGNSFVAVSEYRSRNSFNADQTDQWI